MADVAVVLGAGPGIGAAAARRFADEGMSVVLVARDAARLEALAPQVGAAGWERADVGDQASLQAALRAVRERHGDPALLLHNPSVHLDAALAEVDLTAARAALEVGTTSFLVALQEVLPAMRAAGRGSVLATGGGLALHPSAGYGVLSAEKAAVRALVLAAHGELAGDGVHVATATVAGVVGDGAGQVAPSRVAEALWTLHAQPRGSFEAEAVVRA